MCIEIEANKTHIIKNLKLLSHLQTDELELVCKICTILKERNIQLIERVVHRKGTKFCQNILDITLNVLENGGQYTNDGLKRTPGGVFLNILKRNLTKGEIKFIWSEQVQRQRQFKRNKKRKMDTDERLQKALTLSQEAVEHDKNQNYEAAFDYYLRALDQWAIVCKYQKNQLLQEKFFAKMKEYVDRAEVIKQILNKGVVSCGSRNIGTEKNTINKNLNDAIEQVEGAISTTKPNVKWDDIAGLDSAKEALQEAVILPIRFPNLFTGKLKPWHGILLYGPPGTGKTYLAQACATECNATFISISSSDVMSKWQGESEKFVKSLFQIARDKAPSVIFIDEIDSMCSARSDNENETSRRIKTEFLIQMQGISSDNTNVLVLAATNLPWSLDSAIIRRFERRIYIPLPDERARKVLLLLSFGDSRHNLTDEDLTEISKRTEGYSGSDLSILVRDALMQPIRKCKLATHFKEVIIDNKLYYTPCSPGDLCKTKRQCNLMSIEPDKLLPPIITRNDFMITLSNSRSSIIKSDLNAYEEWTKQYGQDGV